MLALLVTRYVNSKTTAYNMTVPVLMRPTFFNVSLKMQ